MGKPLVKLVIRDKEKSLLFVPIEVPGDILYLPEKPLDSWEDKVTANVIKRMVYYSSGSGQELWD